MKRFHSMHDGFQHPVPSHMSGSTGATKYEFDRRIAELEIRLKRRAASADALPLKRFSEMLAGVAHIRPYTGRIVRKANP
jgi:hypothetical protein